MTSLPKFIRAQRIRFGLKRSLSFQSSDSILMYHNVAAKIGDVFNLRTHLASDFEKQIRFIRSMVPLSSTGRSDFDSTLEITFDDGLANNYLIARPILERYGVPATFFVSTENVDTENLLWPDELEWLCKSWNKPVQWEGETYMPHPVHGIYVGPDNKRLSHELKRKGAESIRQFLIEMRDMVRREMPRELIDLYRSLNSSEIKELSANSLFTIGSHSHRHLPLAGQSTEYQLQELSRSKSILDAITGQSIQKLAFPDGSYDQETIIAAAAAGFHVLYGVNRDEKYPHVKSRTGLYTDEPWYYQLAF